MGNESVETYYLEKSRDLISNWAQAALFVFPKNCDYSGVLIEFDHMLNKAGWLLESSTVFFEKSGFEKVSLMLKGLVKSSSVNQGFFVNDGELCDRSVAELTSHLLNVY